MLRSHKPGLAAARVAYAVSCQWDGGTEPPLLGRVRVKLRDAGGAGLDRIPDLS